MFRALAVEGWHWYLYALASRAVPDDAAAVFVAAGGDTNLSGRRYIPRFLTGATVEVTMTVEEITSVENVVVRLKVSKIVDVVTEVSIVDVVVVIGTFTVVG